MLGHPALLREHSRHLCPVDLASVAVLFARSDSVYKGFHGCDVYDMARDARTFAGGLPVIAHPPCRAWGRLRHFAKPRPDEKDLAFFAVDAVRTWGGVLEHPAGSTLWQVAGLPRLGQRDEFGGFTLPVPQFWFGHRAFKNTWLYVVGISPADIPAFPLVLGEAPCVLETRKKGSGVRPSISRPEREATPLDFAVFLFNLAASCKSGKDFTSQLHVKSATFLSRVVASKNAVNE
ncbi:hypothetical protein [Sulfuricella sp. T08]|uniref:hypothetical protein n=1 Tax=Sulfuricella sp. T08 TaxID=1632857 RepID=UPI00192D16B8|nr:hypothetical protein [Sulfuricella sp. T08]